VAEADTVTLPATIPGKAYRPELSVVAALSAALTAMPGMIPFDVPSRTVPLTVNTVRAIVTCVRPLTVWYIAMTSASPVTPC
jgi:hypothetical protein